MIDRPPQFDEIVEAGDPDRGRLESVHAMLTAAGFSVIRQLPTRMPLQTQVLVAERPGENPVDLDVNPS